MGRKQGFAVAGAVQNPSFYDSTRSPCTKRRTTKQTTSQNMVWVPKIASWEKEFCEKVGLFRWDNFLEAKKATRYSHSRVLEWNDTAAEEAFHRSKNRFFAAINGIPIPDDDVISPDLYIDEIHWDDDDDEDESELHAGLEHSVSDVEDEGEDGVGNPNTNVVRFEDIQPTGWDCKDEDFSPGKILTGQIIGY